MIDVAAATISAGDRVFQAKLSDSTRKSLVEGRWDALGELLEGKGAADAVAARLPAIAPASGTHLGPERRPA